MGGVKGRRKPKMELNKKLSQKRKRELIAEHSEVLHEIYSQFLSDDQMKVARMLIEEIAFMRVNLHVLKYDIIKNGATYLMINGSQEMIVENPSSKVYNSTIPKYNNLFTTLNKMLPSDSKEEVEDNSLFEMFVADKL